MRSFFFQKVHKVYREKTFPFLFFLVQDQDKKMLIAKYTEYLRSISLDLFICSALSRDTYIPLMTQCVARSAYTH